MVHILWKMAALKACPRTFLSGVQLYLNSSIVCSWDSTVILSDIAFIAILLFLKDALIRIFKAKGHYQSQTSDASDINCLSETL